MGCHSHGQKYYRTPVGDKPYTQIVIFEYEEQAAKYYYARARYVGNDYKVYTGNMFFITDDYDTIQATFPLDSNQPPAS